PPHSFFFHATGAPRDLHSFPTRRSSDLAAKANADATASALRADREKLAQAQRNVDVAKAQREAAKARVEQAKAEVVSAHANVKRSEEHTSELQSRSDLVCRLLLEKKKKK